MSYTAKSVIVDIADSWGSTTYLSVCRIEFWYLGSIITVTPGTTCTVYATTNTGSSTGKVWDTSGDKTGSGVDLWYSASGSYTNQRLICVFVTPTTFDEIRVNNSHYQGTMTELGAKNVTINISTDEIVNSTYDAAITNETLIFDGQFDEHAASDVEDEQILTLGSDRTVVADSGSYTIIGSWADFNPFPALPGAYTVTGADVGLNVAVISDAGSYTLTGADAIIYSVSTITATAETYTLTGSDVDLRAPAIVADSGAYTVTGSDTPLVRSTPAGAGSFTLTGAEVALTGLLDADVEITLPSLTFNLYSSGFFEVTTPPLSMDGTGTSGHAAAIYSPLPPFVINTFAGGHGDITTPSISLEMEATVTATATISATLPAFSLSAAAIPFRDAVIDIDFPMMQAAVEMSIGVVGSFTGNLPRFTMGVVALPGFTCDLEGSFRAMGLSMSAAPSGDADIAAELPPLSIALQSGSVASGVLRYVRERVA